MGQNTEFRIANVSHELRTPATIVRSVMELLRMETDSETWSWYLDKVGSALERQETIIEDLWNGAAASQ